MFPRGWQPVWGKLMCVPAALCFLELEAVINYLAVRQPWTPYITSTPGVVGGLTLSILLLFQCCWAYWWSQIPKHDKSSCSAPWSETAALRDRAGEQLFRKTPRVFLNNHCLISRHCCWFYLLPVSFHLSGHGSAASWLSWRGGVPHTPHWAAYRTENIKRAINSRIYFRCCVALHRDLIVRPVQKTLILQEMDDRKSKRENTL